ncbi:ion transporter [Catenovulum sediminis]|uniref:Ion transporter n=1 Tax=Catenovulum sediminis TaxID=1740262 RepID=A0ABV1RGA2_9ALTE
MLLEQLHQKDEEIPGPFDIAMMMLSAIAMLVILAILVLPLEAETKRLLTSIDTMICIVFILHFFFNLAGASNKKRYVQRHWLELVASIPLIEPLRFLRFLQIFRVIRMIRLARSVLLPMLKQRIQTTMAGLLVFMVVIVAGSAVAIFIIESEVPQSNIKTAEDALWWGLITISTVGYGDYYPVTTMGRVISSLLIISGVSLFGVISGYIASSFSHSNVQENIEETVPDWAKAMIQTQAQQNEAMKIQIAQLQKQIEKLTDSVKKTSE